MYRIKALVAFLWISGFAKSISAGPVKSHLLYYKCVHSDDTHVVHRFLRNIPTNTPGGGWVCEWLGRKKGLTPTRGPPTGTACQLTGGAWCHYKCSCAGSGRGLLGLNWSEHASSRKGGGRDVFHLSRLPSFSCASLDWAAPFLSVGFRCWSVGGAHVGSCFLSAGEQRQEIRLRVAALLLSSASQQTAPASATGRPRLCRIPWLWFGYCLVFCPVWSYNSFILSLFHQLIPFFIFYFCKGEQKL